MIFMNVCLVFIIIIIIILCVTSTPFELFNPHKNEILDQNPQNVIDEYRSKRGDYKVVKCECDVTKIGGGHLGFVEHKLKCPDFRKKNPNLTVKDMMIAEGFAFTSYEQDWPPADPNVIRKSNLE